VRDKASAPTPSGGDAEAGKDREGIEREVYQKGFLAGQAAGREQGRAEVQSVLDQLSRSLASLAGLRSRIRDDAERDLVKLAIAIARRVLHRELTLDPESIEGLIRVALEKLEAREVCRVRVHPDQEATIRNSLERFSNSQKVELISDPSLQCGDVLFETAHGDLNGSVEAQLQEIERGLADRLQRAPQNR
jgi:flagellar assembly protein FliH